MAPDTSMYVPNARVVLTQMLTAARALDEARVARAAFITDVRRAGVRPADIARVLRTAAEEEHVTAEEVKLLGISESSIRLTLKLVGAARADDDEDGE